MNTNAPPDASDFSADDLELLAYLLEDEGIELVERRTIAPRARQDDLPLSFAQARLWFLDQLAPGLTAYNLPFAIRLAGRLDLAALRRGLNEIVRRHEALRTIFPSSAGQPRQQILPALTLTTPLLDLRALPQAQRDAAILRQAADAARQPFDLARGPLIRARLLRRAPAEHVAILVVHHIIFDRWSIDLFLQEIMALYDAFARGEASPLDDLPVQYADYALWQRDQLAGEALDQQLAYWRGRLGGSAGRAGPPALELPTDRPRPPRQTYDGAHLFHSLPHALVPTLASLGQRAGATLFMALLAGFVALLSRYSGQDDIVVGSPVPNRDLPELEDLLGLFVNMLPLRADLAGDPPFRELLARVREATLGAYANQGLPFEKLIEDLKIERSLSHTPLFQVMFALQNTPLPSYERAGLSMRFLPIDSGAARFDLMLALSETPSGLNATLEYNTALFDAPTMRRLLAHYAALLAGAAADPERRLADLPLLTPAERHQALVEWNDTASEASGQKPAGLIDLVAAQAARSPDAVALAFDSMPSDEESDSSLRPALRSEHAVRPACPAHLTYAELDRRANRLAHHLRGLGAQPGARIGVCAGRSVELVVALLGALKAGAAYVPIDPSYPPERIRFLLEDSQARILVTNDERRTTNDEGGDSSFVLRPSSSGGSNLVDLAHDWPAIAAQPDDAPAAPDPAAPAYAIYTSGSTGRPKGVLVSHGALANLLAAMRARPSLTPRDVLLAVTTIAFDIAGLELWLPLTSGARVVLSDRPAFDGSALAAAMARWAATVVQATPATWRLLLLSGWRPGPTPTMLCGGEALPRDLANQLARDGARLWNMYGPTETTIWSAAAPIAPGDAAITIGRPIANTQIYLLDRRRQPVPIGAPGELYIGGSGLAEGYLDRPDLTADRFIPNPFVTGSGVRGQESDPDPRPPTPDPRLYRTGDLARFRPDGRIEHLGRIDGQVKIRGFRIEPGEVEAALRTHPDVADCAVVARADGGEARLAAYVVPRIEDSRLKIEDSDARPAAALSAIFNSPSSELRGWLAARLPAYMIPAAFVALDALPRTPNGKLDRRALPAPDAARATRQERMAAPRTAAEQRLAAIWARVLGLPQVGIYDNFFALGGDSFTLVQAAAAASQAGLALTPQLMLQHQTIAAAAALAGDDRVIAAEQGLAIGPLPLTPNQALSFETHDPDRHIWNLAMLFEVEQRLDAALLAQATRALLAHHDALRMYSELGEGGWKQFIAPPREPPPYGMIDLSALPPHVQRAAITAAAGALQGAFDLRRGPLLRVASFDLGPGQPGRLLILVHHTACDRYSAEILWDDFQAAYEQLRAGRPIRLPPKTSSLIAYAERLVAYARSGALDDERGYWLAPERRLVRPLPLDYPGGVHTGASARTIGVALSREETAALQRFGAGGDAALIEALLAAFATTLRDWSSHDLLLIDLEHHGRAPLLDDIDLLRTVGWINHLFPLLLDLHGAPDPAATLQAVKAQLRAVPRQGIGYGALRYLRGDADLAARLRDLPHPQALFNYRGGRARRSSPLASAIRQAREPIGVSYSLKVVRQHLLIVDGFIADDQLWMNWTYSDQAHRRATVERLAQRFFAALRQLLAALAPAGD